jgi:hypothetical protein
VAGVVGVLTGEPGALVVLDLAVVRGVPTIARDGFFVLEAELISVELGPAVFAVGRTG